MDKRILAVAVVIGLVVLAFAFLAPARQATFTEQQIQPEIQNANQPAKVGLHGTVTLASGNCMPGPDINSCANTKVSRTIYIRGPATIANMDGTYLKTKTNLVAQATSDANGYYEVNLPAGVYSVFVEDGGREYCNLGGGLGEECQVTVKDTGALKDIGLVKYDIKIDKAVY
jgi:hypothetical protein